MVYKTIQFDFQNNVVQNIKKFHKNFEIDYINTVINENTIDIPEQTLHVKSLTHFEIYSDENPTLNGNEYVNLNYYVVSSNLVTEVFTVRAYLKEFEQKVELYPDSGVYLFSYYSKNKELYKIGNSTNVYCRYNGMLTSNPDLVFEGYIETKDILKLERSLQSTFQHLRYKGEWFYSDPIIMNYYKSHPDFKLPTK